MVRKSSKFASKGHYFVFTLQTTGLDEFLQTLENVMLRY